MTPDGIAFPSAVAAALAAELPAVAEHTVAAVVVEVPSYADAFDGGMGATIENAVQLALGGFLELAAASSGADASTPIAPALEGAYALGRGEARDGRSMDALLAAYRVGARVAWRDMSTTAVRAGLTIESLASFAELVFAYIDRLSASSVAGHADELATSGRVRQRYLERLAALLVGGGTERDQEAAAERAGWVPPRSLTAVLLPEVQARGALAVVDGRTLQLNDVPDVDPSAELTVLLVPDAGGPSRTRLLGSLRGRGAVVGPARPWLRADGSYRRTVQAFRLGLEPDGPDPLDTETRLPELVLRADEDALADLRADALAPLADLAPAARDRLSETLRSWLLHHGRRERIAAELFIHPQTVRYRMGQLRELYGDRLEDPQTVLALTIALGARRRARPELLQRQGASPGYR
ncbi:MAG: putative transcriptional regulator, PucR family [Frankiales bacterium]|nr:putative transcriptional regulator, PucR family [Frankiales bacterium]